LPKVRKILGNRWILQQDGARAHTANNTMSFLNEEGVRVLEWPARSPDISPIENLWSVLKHDVYQRNPQNVHQLRLYVKESIDNNLISNLVESMNNRVQMVIESEGGPIDY